MKFLVYIFGMLIVCCGCGGIEHDPDGQMDGEAVIALDIVTETAMKSRSVSEIAISDVNIYLFGSHDLHFYSPGSSLSLKVPYGEYQVMVIANAGKNIGDLTRTQVENYSLGFSGSGNIPMSGTGTIYIKKSNGPVQQFPPITVSRSVAKISYNIRIADNVSGLSLYSVQFFNVPNKSFLFKFGPISHSATDYRSSSPINLSSYGKVYSGHIYINENLQGKNTAIKADKDKTFANAPKYATYILVRTKSSSGFYDYVVYPGENSRDDFNVRRNTSTTINITIQGTNSYDARIHTFDVNIEKAERTDKEIFCDVLEEIYVESRSNIYTFIVDVKANCSDNKPVWINGVKGNERSFTIKANESFNVGIEGPPDLITSNNVELNYTITLKDGMGYEYIHSDATLLRNYVYAEQFSFYMGSSCLVSATNGNLVGGIMSSRGTYVWKYAVDPGKKIILNASTSSPLTFEGWYDSNRKRLTTAAYYHCTPQKRQTQLYFNAVLN